MTGPRTTNTALRPATHGPSISERIGQQITSAWNRSTEVAEAGVPVVIAGAQGQILGLAQALAIIRLAPNTPTRNQILSIAEEFKP